MKKIVHVHSDPKFLANNRKRFECDKFDNRYYLVTYGKNPKPGSGDFTHLRLSRSALKKLTEACNQSDLAIIFDLDAFKSRLVNRLDPGVKTAWRFFGYELYTLEKEKYLSDRTLKAYRHSRGFLTRICWAVRNTIISFLSFTRWGTFTEPSFRKAIKNLDYFMGLYEEEYNHLKESWPDLPPFIKLPARKPEEFNSGYLEEKSYTVIIGNSRSMFNNHLDILDLIKHSDTVERIDFTLLFSYGHDYGYADAVRDQAREIPSVTLIEDFLPYDEFLDLYSTTGALVINGYRQMAMANIRQALGSGVKVYLNKRNTAYHHLNNNDFRIFTIDDFAQDIKTGDIILDEEDRVHNYRKLHEAYEEWTFSDFQEQLYRLI